MHLQLTGSSSSVQSRRPLLVPQGGAQRVKQGPGSRLGGVAAMLQGVGAPMVCYLF